MTEHCPTTVCAVCSMYCPPHTITSMGIAAIPNLGILLADGPTTDELPRRGLTTYLHEDQVYCLQPSACTSGGTANVCSDCLASLRRGSVPPASLVRVDTGSIPWGPIPELQLAPLTMVEEISPGTFYRIEDNNMYTCVDPSGYVY